jgi:hypothetical protein
MRAEVPPPPPPPAASAPGGELRDAVRGVMEDLRCAICYDPMVNAHVLSCSHSFCGGCIFQWLEKVRRACEPNPCGGDCVRLERLDHTRRRAPVSAPEARPCEQPTGTCKGLENNPPPCCGTPRAVCALGC